MSARFPSIFSFSKLAVVAVAAMVVFSHPGVAEEDKSSAQIWLRMIDEGEGIKLDWDIKEGTTIQVGAVGAGIIMTNEAVQNYGGVGLICAPKNLAINKETHVGILRQFVAKNPKMGKIYAPGVLLFALMETFLCE